MFSDKKDKYKNNFSIIKNIICFVFVLCTSVGAWGTTYYWIGGTSGNWNDGNNWSTTRGGTSAGAYPDDNTDTAIINSSSATTVTLNGDVSVFGLLVYGSSACEITSSNNKLSVSVMFIGSSAESYRPTLGFPSGISITENQKGIYQVSNTIVSVATLDTSSWTEGGTNELNIESGATFIVTDKWETGNNSQDGSTYNRVSISDNGNLIVSGERTGLGNNELDSILKNAPNTIVTEEKTDVDKTFIWSGNTDTDWLTDNNWLLGTAPSSTDTDSEIIIPKKTNQPIISSSTTVKSIAIQKDAKLTTVNDAGLTFESWSGDGELVVGKSDIEYTGSSEITIAKITVNEYLDFRHSSGKVNITELLGEDNSAIHLYNENVIGKLSAYSSITFDGNNEITNFTLGKDALASSIDVTFKGGSTQKIGTITCIGNSSSTITLKSSDSSKWNVEFTNSPTNTSFKYTVIENSSSSNELNLYADSTSIVDSSFPSSFSTENWFATKYYWIGKNSSSWLNASGENWALKDDGTYLLPSDIYPPISSGEIDIVLSDSSQNELSLFDISDAVNIKSLSVGQSSSSKSVIHLFDNDVICSESDTTKQLLNYGTIVFSGTGRIKNTTKAIMDNQKGIVEYDSSDSTARNIENYFDDNSTNDYYKLVIKNGRWNCSKNLFASEIITIESGAEFILVDEAEIGSESENNGILTVDTGTSAIWNNFTNNGTVTTNGTLWIAQNCDSITDNGKWTFGIGSSESINFDLSKDCLFEKTTDNSIYSNEYKFNVNTTASKIVTFKTQSTDLMKISSFIDNTNCNVSFENVEFLNDITFYGKTELNSEVAFDSDITIESSSSLTMNGPVSATVKGDWIRKGTFDCGSSTVKFTVDSVNSKITNDNTWNNLEIDTSSNTSSSTILFESGKMQSVNGTFSAKGDSTNKLTLTSTGTWNVYFANKPTNADFEYTIVSNSISVENDGNSDNELHLFLDSSSVIDASVNPLSTTNWFTTKFYWLGGTSSSWTTATNWSVDGINPLFATAICPDLVYGFSEIIITDGTSDSSSPYILELDSAIKIKSLLVETDKSISLNGQNIDILEQFTNNGTVLLNGTETINLPITNLVAGTSTTENGTWHYLGGIIKPITNLSFGTLNYNEIIISENASINTVSATKITITEDSSGSGITLKANTNCTINSPVVLDTNEITTFDLALSNLIFANTVTNETGKSAGIKIVGGTSNFVRFEKGFGSSISPLDSFESGNNEVYFHSAVYADSILINGKTILGDNANPSDSTKYCSLVKSNTTEFKGDIESVCDVTFDSTNIIFSKVTPQSITSIGNQIYKGSIQLDSSLKMSATGKTIELHEISSGTGSLDLISEIATLYSGDYITDGSQKFTCIKGVRILPENNGKWQGNSIDCATSDLFLDFTGKNFELATNLSAKQIFFTNGTLKIDNGVIFDSLGTCIILGASYNETDSKFSASNSRFATDEYSSADYTVSVPYSAAFDSSSEGTLKVENGFNQFFVNGTDLSFGSLFTIELPNIEDSAVIFDATTNAKTSKWGEKTAIIFNSTIKNCTVIGNGAYIAASTEMQNVKNSGGNTEAQIFDANGIAISTNACGFQFVCPKIINAYSVYDDVICIEFNMPLENSHNEIKNTIALNTNKNSGGIWYNDGAISASMGVYTDEDCSIPLSSSDSDITKVYVRTSNSTWNTDATGTSSGNLQSTDSSGIKQNVKIDLSFLHGNFVAEYGHTHCLNYNAGSSSTAYTQTEDHCSPSLIAVSYGQELHTYTQDNPATQKIYDAHNFLEFIYSEEVDIGDLSSSAGDLNVQANATFASASEHGGAIKNIASGIEIEGFASIASGKVVAGFKTQSAGSWSGAIDESKPHALYRKFSLTAAGSETVQTHRVRISIAGFVDELNPISISGTNFRNYLGYIDEIQKPSGMVTKVANNFITDLAEDSSGNPLKNPIKSGTTNHPLSPILVSISNDILYGNWDVSKPVFAPYTTSFDTWAIPDSASRTYELIGSANNATDSYLSKVEFHLFDNTHNYDLSETYKWVSRRGWVSGSDYRADISDSELRTPENLGSSRDFTLGGNKKNEGGIRRCSLDGAASGFTYSASGSPQKAFGTTEISQKANSQLFTYVDYNNAGAAIPTTVTYQEGLYFAIPLNPSDTTLLRRTTFVVKFIPGDSSSPNCFITDLAGNRLMQTDDGITKTLNSVDVTPPEFSISLAPIGTNKLMMFFTKTLCYNNVRLKSLDNATLTKVLNGLLASFDFVDALPNSVYEATPFEKVEIAFETSDSTALLFTLKSGLDNFTLDNVEKLWIRLNGTTSDVTDWTGSNTSWVQDENGNGMFENTCHALSDFALNAVNVLYAYSIADEDGDGVDDEDWNEKSIYGNGLFPDAQDYAVHEFDANAGNYGTLKNGRDIFMQVQFVGGEDSNGYFPPENDEQIEFIGDKKSNISSSWVGDKFTRITGKSWRVWLPTLFDSYSSGYNPSPFFQNILGTPAGDSANLLQNIYIKKDLFETYDRDEVQFMFKIKQSDGITDIEIDHDGNPLTPKVPLYALWMPKNRIKSGDFSFVDLWSFRLKDIKNQRGGVTILNNVINATVKEKTVVKVDMKTEGTLNVYVMTLDGNIVKRLTKGKATAGTHYYYWDGTNNAGKTVARGLYFVRVSGKNIDETRKVMVVK